MRTRKAEGLDFTIGHPDPAINILLTCTARESHIEIHFCPFDFEFSWNLAASEAIPILYPTEFSRYPWRTILSG
jgi:hypothetical protein